MSKAVPGSIFGGCNADWRKKAFFRASRRAHKIRDPRTTRERVGYGSHAGYVDDAVLLRRQSRPPLYFSFAELGTVDNRTAFFVGSGAFGPAGWVLPEYVFVRVETPSLISWI
jgi:hypothetical protein